MKNNTCIFVSLAISSLLIYVACSKAAKQDEPSNVNNPTNTIDSTKITGNDSTFDTNNLSVNASTCTSAPNYGDSIVYVKPKNGGDFFANPINNIGVDGIYFAWPEGLKINKNSGAINLSQS